MNELLKTTLKGPYRGYELRHITESLLSPEEVRKTYSDCKLEKIPHKISYFLKREFIKEVYRFNKWAYYVISINNNVFILDY